MKKDICNLIGIKYPIFQGGMAWVSESTLAAAVSNAGGLGIISGANAPASHIRDEIKKTKKLTNKPFGLNIMLLSDNADELADIAIEEGVKVITTGAGNPGKYINKWKNAGIIVIPVVASVALAKRMERCGADAVIAEGCESGGHIGKLTTMVLLPQVVDAVNIPVIGAGGIADGRGIAAAFILGASAVQVGTRFLASEECQIHENYKNAVIKAKDIDTVVTGRCTGHPVQVLKNKLAKEYLKLDINMANDNLINMINQDISKFYNSVFEALNKKNKDEILNCTEEVKDTIYSYINEKSILFSNNYEINNINVEIEKSDFKYEDYIYKASILTKASYNISKNLLPFLETKYENYFLLNLEYVENGFKVIRIQKINID